MTMLNPQYVIAPSLQQYFVDKDTGLPLSSGYVVFLDDNSRTTSKPVYSLAGSPGSYVYNPRPTVAVPNQPGLVGVQLTDIGTFDPAVVYYYPFDNTGAGDLYFIEIYDMNGVFQFSVEAYPNFFGSGSGGDVVSHNFAPNGQFWFHTDIPATNTTLAGQITQDSTPVAQGGWTMEMSPGFSSTTFVKFHQYPNYSMDSPSNPIGRPRYTIELQTTNSDSHTQDLTLTFADANKFNGQTYTFAFSGTSKSGANLNAEVYAIYNFGTGGSGNDTQFLGNITFTTGTFTIIPVSFTFQNISSFTIGPFNDDNVQIRIRFPAGNTYHVEITDVILAAGDVISPIFPDTTVSEFCYEGISGFLPEPFSYAGANYYLPLVVTPFGLDYDTQVVGNICASMSTLANNPAYLPCAAQTLQTNQYTGYIPNSRLQEALFDISTGFPLFGTGSDFVTTNVFSADTTSFRFWTNAAGAVTAPADGAGGAATGFTFGFAGGNPLIRASTGGFFAFAFYINGTVYVKNLNAGAVTASTSNFTGQVITNIRGSNSFEISNNAQLFSFSFTGFAASQFLRFFTYNSTPQEYYIWLAVDGAGSDPGGGGTPIRVNVLSTYTVAEVAQIIVETINGLQISQITTVAGNVLPPNSYWTFSTLTPNNYVVWYSLNGGGTQPTVMGGPIYIPVSYLNSDTAAMIAAKTVLAINSFSFALPDLRGVFLRGFDNGAGIDPDSALRYALNGVTYGDQIGTYQIDEIIEHFHNFNTFSVLSRTSSGSGTDVPVNAATLSTTNTGGNESRPVNVYTNYLIHL